MSGSPDQISKSSRLGAVAWGAYLLSSLARAGWIFWFHPPGSHVYSDMSTYLTSATRILSGTFDTSPNDTIYPPGTAYFYSLLLRLPWGQGLISLAQLILSCLLPLLVWQMAKVMLDAKTGYWALLLSSLHPFFIYYSGLYLSETLFTTLLTGAVLTYLTGWQSNHSNQSFAWLFLSGLLWGAATAVKTIAILPGAVLGIVLLYRALHQRTPWRPVAGLLIGTLLILIPLSVRCTNLAGKFCAVSTNAGLNFLQSHYGPTGLFTFTPVGGDNYWFQSPSTIARGYPNSANFDFAPYSESQAWAKAGQYLAAQPSELIRSGLEQTFNLFLPNAYFPAMDSPWAVASHYLILIIILIPALLFVLDSGQAIVRPWIILVVLVCLILTAFVFSGEPRYRVSFDPFFIVLAAYYWHKLAPQRLWNLK